MRAALAYAIGAALTLTGGVADLAYINVSLVPRMLDAPQPEPRAEIAAAIEPPVVEAPVVEAPVAEPPVAEPPPPEPPVIERPAKDEYEIVAVVRFKFGSSELDEDAQAEVAAASAKLRAEPRSKVRAHGHADERGPSPFNLDLSERRAKAVAAELERLGIEGERIERRGFGEEMASERWSRDRRVEISMEVQ